MDRPDLTANCAICGGPGEPECPCEGRRLEQAIDQAEKRWIETWIARTREWATNNSVAYVTATFNRLKSIRLAKHNAYLQQLPYWPLWEQYNGHPPLHPHIVAQLQRQIAEAGTDLRRGIDADWKSCVIRYPEVLAHFYGAMTISPPKQSEVQMPNLSGLSAITNGPPPPLLTNSRVQPPLHRSQTAPPKRPFSYAPPSTGNGGLGVAPAELRARIEALAMKDVQPSRPVRPQRSGSNRLSVYSGQDDFLQPDDDYGDMRSAKPAMPRPGRRNSATPGPPSSNFGDMSPTIRRKRRDSAQFSNGSSKGHMPSAPSAPGIWDQIPGVLGGGAGQRTAYGGIAF